jgi:hypothetical protein
MMRRMAHHHRWITRGIAVALTVTVVGLTGVSAAQQKGRYKKEGSRCVWNAEDSGPNQCEPIVKGRFKKSGDDCVWAAGDAGENQCRPAKGRFKKSGDRCVWDANDGGPDQCDPRTIK